MEVSQLRYAVAVADEGTFTAAAAACFVAQPSLSQAVRNLERELGVELFVRLPRRAQPTAAGEAFVAAARRALHALGSIAAEVALVAGVMAGTLDLVTLPTLAHEVAPLVGAFRAAHPGVTTLLAQPDGTADLVEAVRTGRSEVGITVPSPELDDRLLTRTIGRQEIVAVLPPGAQRRRRISAAELAGLPLVVQPAGTATRALLDDLLAGTAAPEIAVVTDQREAIVPLVAAGAGAAVLPRAMAAAVAGHAAHVVTIEPRPWRDIVLVHRPAALSPAGAAFARIAGGTPGTMPPAPIPGGRR